MSHTVTPNGLSELVYKLALMKLADYVTRHGINCYISNNKLYAEITKQTSHGAVYIDTVEIVSYPHFNRVLTST